MNGETLRLSGRVELAAVRFNTGAPHRVLALHGWLDNALSFEALAAQLPGFEITALDFAGHGESAHLPTGAWYHFVDYLDDIAAAIRHAGPFDLLLGHSLGGAVATAYAAARPEEVPRLALIEALGPIAGAPEAAAEALRVGLREREALANKSLRLFADPAQAVAARLQANRMHRSSAERLIRRGLRRAGEGWIWASDPRLTVASPLRLSEPAIQTWIAAIEAPTLLIAAEQTPPYFVEATRTARSARLRNGELHVLPGHHHLHMDDPQPVADVLSEWFQRQKP